MADKKELRTRILKAYCAINDVLNADYEGMEPRGKDIGAAALMMIARNAIHWALDIVDYEAVGRPSTPPCGPKFDLPDTLKLESEYIDVIRGVVAQACTMEDGTLDSIALTYYANAIKVLAQAGKVEITSEAGRRITARWKEKAEDPPSKGTT